MARAIFRNAQFQTIWKLFACNQPFTVFCVQLVLEALYECYFIIMPDLLEGWVRLVKFRRKKNFKDLSVFQTSCFLINPIFFPGQRIYDSKLIPLLICCYTEYQRANEFFCFRGYDLHLVWITWFHDVKPSVRILWSDFFIFTACTLYLLHSANTELPCLSSAFTQRPKWQGVSMHVKATIQICCKTLTL